MNKKGFTLIELLGTIVLLGVIAVISVPIVNSLIDAAKTQALNESIKSIERAAERYVMDGGELEDGIVTIQTLLEEGYLKSVDDNISINDAYVECEEDNGIYEFEFNNGVNN